MNEKNTKIIFRIDDKWQCEHIDDEKNQDKGRGGTHILRRNRRMKRGKIMTKEREREQNNVSDSVNTSMMSKTKTKDVGARTFYDGTEE